MLAPLLLNQQNRPPGSGEKYVVAIATSGTAALLLAANPYRRGAIITNTHATVDAVLGKDSGVTTSTGILLVHAGGQIVDPGSKDAWYVVAGSAGTIAAIDINT